MVISKLARMEFKIFICNNPVLFQSVLTKWFSILDFHRKLRLLVWINFCTGS